MTPVEQIDGMKEFVDGETGIRLTIVPEHGEDNIAIHMPDKKYRGTYEEFMEVVHKLLRMAGLEKNDD